MTATRNLLLGALTVLLTACGTTSSMRPADAGTAPDLSSYRHLLVRDFSDGTDASKVRDNRRMEYSESVAIATRHFADLIAGEARTNGRFTNVSREGTAGADTLVIDGRITRYAEGSAAARFFVGFGAGSSYFDAVAEIRDGATGTKLGEVVVDKNSWVLGGGLAAGQNVEGFMRGAAKKIVAELMERSGG